VHITAQAVELRYDHGSLVLLGQLHRCGQLRPLFERIGAFAGLDLAETLRRSASPASLVPRPCGT
jgi:hypothetical protein